MISRTLKLAILLSVAWSLFSAGCHPARNPMPKLDPAACVEVGTVLPASAFDTMNAFRHAGIPAYINGADYPNAQRILVRPEDRDRALALLRDLQHRPLPYLVTPG